MTGLITPAFLAEPFALLTKTVNIALAEIETRCKQDIKNAVTDANECRRRRDEALQELSTCKTQLAETNNDLKKAESTVISQAEIIQQLKRDVSQWKERSRNWQDYFLKAEQSRCDLSTRVEELASEMRMLNGRLRRTPASGEQTTPNTPSSSTTKRGSTTMHEMDVTSVHDDDDDEDSVYSPRPTKIQKIAGPAIGTPSHKSSEPRKSVVLRRVQAVIHTHVKDEEDDDEVDRIVSNAHPEALFDEPRTSSAKSKGQRRNSRRIIEDDEGDSEGASEHDPDASVYRKPSRKRPVPEGPPEEEAEDELMLRPETTQNEQVFGRNVPIPTTYKAVQPAPARRSRKPTQATTPGTTSAQKRKVPPVQTSGRKRTEERDKSYKR